MPRGMRLVAVMLGLGLAGCGGGARRARTASCADAAEGAFRNLQALRSDLAEANVDARPELVALCSADQWRESARRCFAIATSPKQARSCAGRLTEPQRVRARAIQAEAIERAAAQLRERGSATTGIPECDEYVAAIDALAACDRVPRHVRDAMQQTKETIAVTWLRLDQVDPSTYAAAREAIAAHCRQAGESTRQSARAMGCE